MSRRVQFTEGNNWDSGGVRNNRRRPRRRRQDDAGSASSLAGVAPFLNAHNEIPDLPAGAQLKLTSSEGHIFEVCALEMCRQSILVRTLVDDSGIEEEIPLPGLRSRSLELLLVHLAGDESAASRKKGGLRAPQRDSLIALHTSDLVEVHAAARLLHMDGIDRRVLACMAQQLNSVEQLPELSFDIWLWLVRDGASHFSAHTLCEIIDALRVSCPEESNSTFIRGVSSLLSHSQCDVRNAVAVHLLSIGSVEALDPLLTCNDFAMRSRASRVLPPHCPKALARMLALSRHDNFQVRETAVKSFTRLADAGNFQVLAELVERLQDPAHEVRDAVVQALPALMGNDTAMLKTNIFELLTHDDWPVQSSALRALAIVAYDDRDLTKKAATRLMESSATRSRHVAARVLKDLASEEDATVADSRIEDLGSTPEKSPTGGIKLADVSMRGKSWADGDFGEM